jgi:hypothetical protein
MRVKCKIEKAKLWKTVGIIAFLLICIQTRVNYKQLMGGKRTAEKAALKKR